MGAKTIRERIASNIKKALDENLCSNAKEAMEDWLNNKDIGEGSRERAEKLETALQGCSDEIAKEILKDKESLLRDHNGYLVEMVGLTILGMVV